MDLGLASPQRQCQRRRRLRGSPVHGLPQCRCAFALSMADAQPEILRALRTLGLRSDNACSTTVKNAYLALAKEYHPDVAIGCKAAAAARFKSIVNAYELLSEFHGAARRARSVQQQYEDLMAQRAREPFIIRWFWRGPSIGVKLRLKLATMVGLFVACLIDERARGDRRR